MRLFYSLGIIALFFLTAGSKGCEDNAKNDVGQQAKEEKNQAYLACEKNEDCVAIKKECCTCNQGGANISVARAHAQTLLNERRKECHDKACMQVISNDPSCGQKAVCEEGHCALK